MTTGFTPPPAPPALPGESLGDHLARIEQARNDAYDAWMAEQGKGPRHIRKQAGRNLGNQYYSHHHRTQFLEGYVDPTTQTLCDAPAGFFDETWAATRFAKNRATITCRRCLELRLADPRVIRR